MNGRKENTISGQKPVARLNSVTPPALKAGVSFCEPLLIPGKVSTKGKSDHFNFKIAGGSSKLTMLFVDSHLRFIYFAFRSGHLFDRAKLFVELELMAGAIRSGYYGKPQGVK